MYIRADALKRSLQTLEASLQALRSADTATIEFDIYRNAVIKGFELILELSGKLLRKALKAFEGNPKAVDNLSYKAVFRQSARHGLLPVELVERWFLYRDNRNNTAHDYGIAFAQDTLALLPSFIQDAQVIIDQLSQTFPNDDDA